MRCFVRILLRFRGLPVLFLFAALTAFGQDEPSSEQAPAAKIPTGPAPPIPTIAKPPALVDPNGPAISLQTSESLFDVAVARAVAELPRLSKWMLPLVKPGGIMLAMKGPKVKEELPAAASIIRRLAGGSAQLIPAGLPGAEGHVIVRVEMQKRPRARSPKR